MNEIENIGKAYDEMAEQNEKLLKQLDEKDDTIARLLSEVCF